MIIHYGKLDLIVGKSKTTIISIVWALYLLAGQHEINIYFFNNVCY